ncbi:FtsX-like permease family protein [uncultured Bacteroides sp.]|uniref:FtsX-like permease family protein n=1 Tax=uncultured Bacteroides sp. TaxID=162156 RepID=UPI0025F8E51C|nr:FtsX-like permease family protein [uncultured Bacteroides sp.]
MIKHYIKVALRLIKRSFLFSSINMLGFVFGMTAAFLIYLWVVNELTYDDCFPSADRIYRAIEVNREASGEIKESPGTARSLVRVFKTDFPQVEDATSILYRGDMTLETETRHKISGNAVHVDSTFFSIFPFQIVEGNPERINDNIDNIILEESMARKLFGMASAIGQKVTRSGAGFKDTYNIVAVVKIPSKSHIRFDVALPMEGYGLYIMNLDWDKSRREVHVYVKMKPGDDGKLYRREQKTMSRALSKFSDKRALLRFQSVRDIHLRTTFPDIYIKNHGSVATIYLFVVLAILVIFMGAFNFMTLSTARASLRYKEIGVRKVTGAKRKTLVTQFLSESLVQSFISLVLALALTELMLPLFNQVMGTDLTLSLNWNVIFYILFGILGVGCLAGSYPAFYLSSVNPLLAFKGGRKTGKKGGLIKSLVCIQFLIALLLMLMTSIVLKQLYFMKNKDLGLDKENIVSIYTNLWYDVADFKQDLLRNPAIKSISMGSPIESFGEENQETKDGESISWTDIDGKIDSLRMVEIWADGNFVETFGLQLLKGELMNSDFEDYWLQGDETNPVERTVVINETAWKAMKVANPIGMEISREESGWVSKYRIVGMVKDFNFQSLREKMKPAFIYYSPETLVFMYIKIAPEHKPETLKYIQAKFEEWAVRDDLFVKEFNYQFFSDALNKNYAKEQQQSRMLLFFTIIAIVIAMLGVFGLVTLSTEQRTKEIGVRKVNGAHSDRIVKMFCMEYLKWVGIAFVVASPTGYYLMYRWLGEFAYQTVISWWLFILAGAVIAGITLLTVIGQTWRKASQNPVVSLRYE